MVDEARLDWVPSGSKPMAAQATEMAYNRSVATQLHLRSRAEILRLFDGYELVEPGLV